MTVTWYTTSFLLWRKGTYMSGKNHTTLWYSVNEYTDSLSWSQHKRKVQISGFLPYEFWLCQLDRFCWFRFSRFLWILTDSVVKWNCPLVCPHADLSLSVFCSALKPGRTDLPVSSIFYLFICTLSGIFFLQRLWWWLFLWVFSACAHKNMLNIRATPFS